MDLFAGEPGAGAAPSQPLASRMRPRTLEEVEGQDHILGPGRLLRRAIEADRLSSIILFGPPGCGKTSLAEVIARVTRRRFERTSGVLANVETLRALIRGAAQHRDTEGHATILFVDEIHRFNKAQQDVLLPHVEDGTITLIGATTHNPMFFINTPLTSRSLVFELKPLPREAVRRLAARALADPRGFPGLRIRMDDAALDTLATLTEGDARRSLNALEIAVLTTHPNAEGEIHLTVEVVQDSVQKKLVAYDRDEDGHYDTISAFIKSVRGSDPAAAVYWLAKMIYAGEDPRFIARRLIILASEDVGNADPRGLSVAVAGLHAVELVGMPEGRIVLSQVTTYLATAPKSNAAYLAVDAALEDVRSGRAFAVPGALKNVRLRTAGGDAESPEYRYPHDYAGHHVAQSYVDTGGAPLPEYYQPTDQGYEETIARRMARLRSSGGAA